MQIIPSNPVSPGWLSSGHRKRECQHEQGLVHHGRRARHGRRHRQGCAGRRPQGRRDRPQPRQGRPGGRRFRPTCSSSKLDVTNPADAEAAVKAAVERFGRIDVLVNNAASFYAGYFEELTPEQMERQLATSLIGPMNVTRAVLPVMRKQRSGHVISISSSAGLAGFEFGTAYAASKFGLEGWMESLRPRSRRSASTTTIVNPGFFRTELLTEESTNYAEPSIADYAERNATSSSSSGRPRTASSPATRPSSRRR